MTKKVFVSIDNESQWIVCEEDKIVGYKYVLASIEDLDELAAGTGEFFTYPLETTNGIVQWFTEDSEGDEGYICEYRLLENKEKSTKQNA